MLAAEDKAPSLPTARDIAESWRFADDTATDKHFIGVGPIESRTLYTENGMLTGGAKYEEIWNFYAKRVGADRKYAKGTVQGVGGKANGGEYVILDRFGPGLSTATFSFATQQYAVTVQLSATSEKDKVHLSITVALR
jgi:hypothetical protein